MSGIFMWFVFPIANTFDLSWKLLLWVSHNNALDKMYMFMYLPFENQEYPQGQAQEICWRDPVGEEGEHINH